MAVAVRERWLTWLVCLGSVVAFGNLYLFHPLLPLLADDFHVSELAANLVMAVPMAGMGCGLLVFAGWADAIGRRAIFLYSILIGVLLTLAMAWVQRFEWLLFLRFWQGFFLAGCPAVAIAFLGDELAARLLSPAVGWFVAANSFGGLSGRVLGGLLAQWSGHWRFACLWLAGSSLLLLLVAIWRMPVAHHFEAKPFKLRQTLRAFALHLANPRLLALYLIAGIAFGVFVNQFSFLLFVLSRPPYQLPSGISGLLFLTYLAGTFSASRAGAFSRRFGLHNGIATGLLVMLGGCLLLLVHQLAVLVVGLALLAAGFFFCHSQASALVGRQVSEAKASAQALYTLFYYLGASLGVFVLQPFYSFWGWHGVVFGVMAAIGVCLLLWSFLRVQLSLLKEKPHLN